MALVGYHQVPKLLVVKGHPDAAWRNLARKAPVRLLYLLEQADMRGRICPDREDQLAILELFRERMGALGLWGARAYADWHDVLRRDLPAEPDLLDFALGAAAHDHESGRIASAEEALARSYALLEGLPKGTPPSPSHELARATRRGGVPEARPPSRTGFGRLFVLVGPSGSGKSTWAARNVPGATRIALDELRDRLAADRSDQTRNGEVRQEAARRLKRALAARETVVFDATNLRADFRAPLLRTAADYGALSTLVVLHRRTAAITAGNRDRPHAVRAEVLADQLDRYQWPEEDEAHRTLIVGDDDAVLHRAGYWS
jgi:predicted kinase